MRAHLQIAAVIAASVTIAAVPAAGSSVTGPDALMAGFACIHRYEGAWSANTGNGYFGGLQMDLTFQRSYGPDYLRAWGTADNWPPSVQVAVAIRAYLSGRGYGPWPNTARLCGLT